MPSKGLSHPDAETRPDTSRHVEDLAIFEHPYVKRLEAQVEKWEGKYQDQVRRTEQLQSEGMEKILELQRMTVIGQSKTLTDLWLKAREVFIGANENAVESDDSER